MNFEVVSLENIEPKLGLLLKAKNNIRIASSNLIVYFQNPSLKLRYYETLLKIISIIPSRTIWIEKSKETESFTTAISASCTSDGCSEHIRLSIPKNFSQFKLINPVRSILLPNIPSRIFYFSTSSKDYNELDLWTEITDEKIIDSALKGDLNFNYKNTIDFSWVSLNKYQNEVAYYFENLNPEPFKKVVLTVSNRPEARFQISYFTSWIINILKFDISTIGKNVFIKKVDMKKKYFFKEITFQTSNNLYTIDLQNIKYPCGIVSNEEVFLHIFEKNVSQKLFRKIFKLARSIYDN